MTRHVKTVTFFLQIVEVLDRWPATASCIMFFFVQPKTVASDRPLALLATQIRWWEWVRADIFDDTKSNRVGWTKEAGGAEYTVWEAMLELEPDEAEAGPKKEPRSSHQAH